MSPEAKEYFWRNLGVLTVLALVVSGLALDASYKEKSSNLARLTRAAEADSLASLTSHEEANHPQEVGAENGASSQSVISHPDIWPVTLPDKTLVYCATAQDRSTQEVVEIMKEQGIIVNFPPRVLIVGAIGAMWEEADAVTSKLDVVCVEKKK